MMVRSNQNYIMVGYYHLAYLRYNLITLLMQEQSTEKYQFCKELGFYDAEQLISEEFIDISAIQRKTQLNPTLIKKKLIQNQSHLLYQFMEPYSNIALDASNNFRLAKFFPLNWKVSASFWPERIQMEQIYEITGKTNTGKTFFCYCLLEESLSKGKNVFVFDTSNNFSPSKLIQWFGGDFIDQYKKSIKRFEVSNLRELGEHLYFLEAKLKEFDIPSVIIIDSLSSLIDSIPFSDNSSAFFALRKEFFSLIESSHSCILYTTLSHQSLFHSAYPKPQEERFKNIHATMWESLTNNGILIDSVLEHDQNENKIVRTVKMCLLRSSTENRFTEFQCIQS